MAEQIKPWVSVYDASLALECSPEEIERGIQEGHIQARRATRKRRGYWQVTDASVLEAFKTLQMEYIYPYLRTERFSRYCARWMADMDAECERSR